MSFKKLKKDLKAAFKKIKQSVEEGQIPPQEDIKHFSKLASRMVNYAEEEWQYEAEDFSHLASQLIGAAKSKDIQELFSLINALEDAKNYCHRTFKA